MKNKKKKLLFTVLISSLILIIGGCSSKESDVESASINQVLSSSSSAQQNATYMYKDGTLDVVIGFYPIKNSNTNPSEVDSSLSKDLERLSKEFPNEKFETASFENMFEKSFKNVILLINKDKKEVTLSSKDIDKTFKMSDSNENRLVDDAGVEYELVIDK